MHSNIYTLLIQHFQYQNKITLHKNNFFDGLLHPQFQLFYQIYFISQLNKMHSNAKSNYSLGIQSYLSPPKNPKLEASLQTMYTNSSLQLSETINLPSETPTKFNQSHEYETYRSEQLSAVQEVRQSPNQIIILQKWVMMYYQDYQLGEQRKKLYNKLIEEQQKSNQAKINKIRALRKSIEKERDKSKKISERVRSKEQLKFKSLEKMIYDTNTRTIELEEQIYEIKRAISHSKPKKKSKPKSQYPHFPIYYDPRNFYQPPQNHSYGPYQTINQGYFAQPRHRKNSSKLSFSPQVEKGGFSEMLSEALKSKLKGNDDTNVPSPQLKRARVSSLVRKSQQSVKWQMDGQEREFIEELQKSEKQSLSNKIDLFQKQNPEASKKSEDLLVSKRNSEGKQKKIDISKHSIRQSYIKIDIPAEDSSYSKSREISIEQQKSLNKSTIQKQKNEETPKNTRQSKKDTRFHEDKFQKSELINRKSIKASKRNMSDVKEPQTINQSAKKSEVESTPAVLKNSLVSFKNNDANYSEEEFDDDDLTNINLLAVSKISKERELSTGGKKRNEEQIDDIQKVRESKSTIIRRSKKPDSPYKIKKSQLQQIVEDEYDITEDNNRERKRKKSGTRFSLEQKDIPKQFFSQNFQEQINL